MQFNAKFYAVGGACDNEPCQNGGTCIVIDDLTDIIECTCAVGFTGFRCENLNFIGELNSREEKPDF